MGNHIIPIHRGSLKELIELLETVWYNNIKHSTTNSKPVDIFYSKDKELFLKIKETKINSTKNYNVDNNEFINSNDYILI